MYNVHIPTQKEWVFFKPTSAVRSVVTVGRRLYNIIAEYIDIDGDLVVFYTVQIKWERR
jgi:hypothetical protein